MKKYFVLLKKNNLYDEKSLKMGRGNVTRSENIIFNFYIYDVW